jgi:hypothetical protein
MLESPKLTLFTLQLNQVIFYLLTPSDQQKVSLSAKIYSIRDMVPNTWRTKASSPSGHVFLCVVKMSP